VSSPSKGTASYCPPNSSFGAPAAATQDPPPLQPQSPSSNRSCFCSCFCLSVCHPWRSRGPASAFALAFAYAFALAFLSVILGAAEDLLLLLLLPLLLLLLLPFFLSSLAQPRTCFCCPSHTRNTGPTETQSSRQPRLSSLPAGLNRPF